MGIYEKELNGVDEIVSEVREFVNGDNLGNKMQVTRMFAMAKEKKLENDKKENIRKLVSNHRKNIDVILIGEDSAIVKYEEDIFNDGNTEWFDSYHNGRMGNNLFDSFDKALIGLVCMKKDMLRNSDAPMLIAKMLEL